MERYDFGSVRMAPPGDIRGERAAPYRPTLFTRDLLPFYLRGVQTNAALYLAFVVIAGLATFNRFAWEPAVISAGLAYLAYTCQALGYNRSERWTFWGNVLAVMSVLLAIAAGVALIV
jgi:hypothetical protein